MPEKLVMFCLTSILRCSFKYQNIQCIQYKQTENLNVHGNTMFCIYNDLNWSMEIKEVFNKRGLMTFSFLQPLEEGLFTSFFMFTTASVKCCDFISVFFTRIKKKNSPT